MRWRLILKKKPDSVFFNVGAGLTMLCFISDLAANNLFHV